MVVPQKTASELLADGNALSFLKRVATLLKTKESDSAEEVRLLSVIVRELAADRRWMKQLHSEGVAQLTWESLLEEARRKAERVRWALDWAEQLVNEGLRSGLTC